MPLLIRDLRATQGVQFNVGFTWDTTFGPRDLTGWSARLVARIRSDSEILLDANTVNGQIILGAAGQIDVSIPASVTGTYLWREARYQLILWPTATPADAVSFARGRFVVLPAYATVPPPPEPEPVLEPEPVAEV